MPTFKVTATRAERPTHNGQPITNPFAIRDIFSPGLRQRIERRTWENIEAEDEAAVRRFFEDAIRQYHEHVHGFTIEKIERIAP